MDENSAESEQLDGTPIFAAFRRGYDPDQVNRYVAEQNRRLDEATHRASEAERKLAAAVGQLRELHRRVAVLENEERSPQPSSLDTLGERVQRVLQEAWEGAYALRQEAENEVTEQKDLAVVEGEEIVAKARRKAEAIEEEIDRRRRAYLERIEADRARAAAQMSFLQEQRKVAVGELERVKEMIETTVAEVSDEPAARSHREVPVEPDVTLIDGADAESNDVETFDEVEDVEPEPEPAPVVVVEEPRVHAAPRLVVSEPELPSTMPVHRMLSIQTEERADAGDLVRSHRAAPEQPYPREEPRMLRSEGPAHAGRRPSVFDFEQQDDDPRS
jgi:hypothetical protein